MGALRGQGCRRKRQAHASLYATWYDINMYVPGTFLASLHRHSRYISYSVYRIRFILRVLRVLQCWWPKYTASTGSLSSTELRVQAVPALQTSEILGVLSVSRVFEPVFAVYTPVLQAFQLPTPTAICSNSHSWVGPSISKRFTQ